MVKLLPGHDGRRWRSARTRESLSACSQAISSLRSTPCTAAGSDVRLNANGLTALTWNADPEGNLTGYEVVMRETTDSDWTSALSVGNVATVTLDMSKDNLQFGIRAVDQDGNRSPVAFSQAVA